ncbi:MAG: hypothetical protein J5672_08645 [Verrucomicrobia bacterium]|nr:hypothetical protein [Verrucomicrobiota bacterium]MBR5738053.1 hypothetical protein [Verrucomicrobiota bacterium]MBR6461418.1 hypothetical protein [Verrucomicrobiota bacterium]
MKITKTMIAEAVSALNEGFTHCEIVQTHKFRATTLAVFSIQHLLTIPIGTSLEYKGKLHWVKLSSGFITR